MKALFFYKRECFHSIIISTSPHFSLLKRLSPPKLEKLQPHDGAVEPDAISNQITIKRHLIGLVVGTTLLAKSSRLESLF